MSNLKGHWGIIKKKSVKIQIMTKLDRTKIVLAECDVNYKWLTEKIIKNSIVF